MTEEAQRVAIAEACGWKQVDPRRWSGYTDKWEPLCSPADAVGAPAKFWGYVPDYLHSLDAMHEAEKVLTDLNSRLYYDNLLAIQRQQFGIVIDRPFQMVHATAAQRLEAILRTLNLWDDTK